MPVICRNNRQNFVLIKTVILQGLLFVSNNIIYSVGLIIFEEEIFVSSVMSQEKRLKNLVKKMELTKLELTHATL